MKKILSFALALLISASAFLMTACGGDNNKDPKDPVDQQGPSDPADPGDPTDPENPEDPTDPADPADPTDPTDPTDPGEAVVFTNVEENVQATVTVELRLQPALDVDNVIGNLRVNEIVRRTGVSLDGTWSRVHMTPAGFEEGIYYVASNCLTVYEGELPSDDPEIPDDPTDPTDPENPDDPDTPADPDDPQDPDDSQTPDTSTAGAVTVWIEFNDKHLPLSLRAEPSARSSVVARVPAGTVLQRVSTVGEWSKVVYNGVECYAKTYYLTTEDISGNNYTTYDTPKKMSVTANSLWVRYCPLDVDGYNMDQEETVIRDESGYGVALVKGDVVTALAVSPDGVWTRILWEDGSQYYVGSAFLSDFTGSTTPTNPSTPSTPTTPTVTFTPLTAAKEMYPKTSGVRVYATPDNLTTAVDTLSMVDLVTCLEISTDGVWYKVNLADKGSTPYYIQAADLTNAGK